MREIRLCKVCGTPITVTGVSGEPIHYRRFRCREHVHEDEPEDCAPQPTLHRDYWYQAERKVTFSVMGSGSFHVRTWDDIEDPLEGEMRDHLLDAISEGRFEVDDWHITDVYQKHIIPEPIKDDTSPWDHRSWLEKRGWSPPEEHTRPWEKERPGNEETLEGWI